MQTKIRILIDIDVAVSKNKSGIGNYTIGMITSLAENYPEIEIIGHYFNFLGMSKPTLPSASNISYKQSKFFPRKLANLLRRYNISLPYEILMRCKPDFIIYPNFLIRKTLFKIPYAVVVHDFTYLEYPQYVSDRNRLDLTKLVPTALSKASLAFVLSSTMANSLKKYYPMYKNPIVPNLIPVKQVEIMETSVAQKQLLKFGINKRYILFVGNIEPRKNITGLVNAYKLLPAEIKQDVSLVLAGGKGWNDESINNAIERATRDGNDVITTGYVTDLEKQALYSNAEAVLLPSFYEGYGIPALEAMAYNKPVLLSDIPVLKEVGVNAALYCDPYDVGDISKKIEVLINDNAQRQQLITAGSQLLKSRTWKIFADKLYHSICDVTDRDNPL